MSEEEGWVARVHALLVDGGGRLLVLDDGDGRRLPYVEVDRTDETLHAIREALAALVGIEAVVVRPVERSLDDERKVLDLGLELEVIGEPPMTTPGAAWLTPAELAGVELPDRDRSLVQRLAADRPPPERPPWARRGWFSGAVEWLDDALEGIGRARTGPVEQVSNWCISSILSAPTVDGVVYLKATARSPLFVDEGVVTRGLAERFPGRVPMPLAVDSAERLMLLDDFGSPVGWGADAETKTDVLARFAALQVESTAMVDDLLALGAFDRSPAWLADAIQELLRDPDDLLGLEREERNRLDAELPTFLENCEMLATGPIPLALVHGDLHLANVAGRDDHFVFFDWTDASVGNPLMDLLAVVSEEIEAVEEALRDVYLSAWIETASPAELLEVWRAAEPLVSLNQAISYRSIIDSVEPGTAPDLEPALPWWLRKALEAASDG